MTIRCKGCNAPIGVHVLRCEFCGTINEPAAQPVEQVQSLERIDVPEEEGMTKDSRYNSVYCSSDDKVFLGVAGGLAHKLNLPSPAVRFILFLVFWSGVAIPFYFVGFFLPRLPTLNVK